MPSFRKPGRVIFRLRQICPPLGAGLLIAPSAVAASRSVSDTVPPGWLAVAGAGLLAAALFLLVRRLRKRARAAREQAVLGSIDLFQLDTPGFMALLQDGYHRQGFTVEPEPPLGDPEDFLIRHGREFELVRCRYWRAQRVGADMVTGLVRQVSLTEARRGVLVTVGQFTPEAVVAARRAGISLLEGARLRRLIDDLNVDWQARHKSRRHSPSPAQLTPACPKCSAPMAARQTGDSARAGEAFWGCTRWPECTGIVFDEELEVLAVGRAPATAGVSGRG